MEKEINTNVKLSCISNRLSAEPGNFNFVAEVKRNKTRRNIKEILLSTCMYKLCFPRAGSVLILRGLCKTAQSVQKKDFFLFKLSETFGKNHLITV
jgi:hypothetical protein